MKFKLCVSIVLAGFWISCAPFTAQAFDADSVSNMVLWLKADAGVLSSNGVPAANGETIQCWQDMSGNGNHAYQYSVAAQLTNRVSLMNGWPAVIGATNKWMMLSNAVNTVSAFFVISNVPTANPGMLLGRSSGGTAVDLFVRRTAATVSFDGNVTTISGKCAIAGGTLSASSLRDQTPTIPDPLVLYAQYDLSQPFTNLFRRIDNTYNFIGQIYEILIYNRTLNATEQNVVGSYLSAKYAQATGYPATTVPLISSTSATGVTGSAAWLNGSLSSTGTSATVVTVCWGTNDGQNVMSNWGFTNNLGTNTAVLPASLSFQATGLSNTTTYYYRYFATNSSGGDWSEPTLSFTTLAGPIAPTVTVAAATSVGQSVARLNGAVTGGFPPPEIYLCYGTNNEGTSSTGAWQYVLSVGAQSGSFTNEVRGLMANQSYYYTCYGVNDAGGRWASTVEAFTTTNSASYTWNSNNGGNWDDVSGNGWNTGGGYPHIDGDIVTFGQTALTASRIITNNVADARVGTLKLLSGAAGTTWTIDGPNTLTFDAPLGSAVLTSSVAAASHSISAPVALATNLTLDIVGGLGMSGSVSGNGGLVKNGTNTLHLSGANTFAGGTRLNSGTLQLSVASALGSGPLAIYGGKLYNASTLTLTTGNAMTWGGNFLYQTPISSGLNMGTGLVTLETNVTVSFAANGYASLLTVGGSIGENGGARSLTIAAGGANPSYLNLTGSNTYSGGTFLTGAGVRIGNVQAFGTGPLTISGGSIQQTVGALTGISGQVWNGDFSLSLTAGAVHLGTSPVTLVGARTVSANNGNATLAGPISGAGASLALNGGANNTTFTISGANSFDGGLGLKPGNGVFTVNINSATALGTGTLVLDAGGNGAFVLNNNSAGAITLTPNNPQSWSNNFTFTGSQNLNMGTGAVTLYTNVTVTASAKVLTVGGIGDSGLGRSLTKAGAGTLELAGVGTYSGATMLNAGTLLASADYVISTNSVLAIASGAVFSNNYIQAVGGLAGTGTVVLGSSAVLSNGFSNTSTTFAGLITGTGAVVKVGSGTLTLSGTNESLGALTVAEGALLVDGLVKSGAVVTVDGGLLGGTGVISRAVTVKAASTLAAGDPNINSGVGTLTLSNLTQQAGSTNIFECTSTSSYDRVVVTTPNGLVLNGGRVFLYTAGGTTPWSSNAVYQLFQYAGSDPSVASLSMGNPVGGKLYSFGTDGTYVTLTISDGIATYVWDGGEAASGNWQSPYNWVGDMAPLATAPLQFDGSARLDNTNDFPANTQFAGITFLGSAGSFALTGNAVNLTADLVNNSANPQTVNLPLVLDGDNRGVNAASGDMTLGGAIDDGAFSFGLIKAGPFAVTLAADNTYDGATTISAGILQVGNGGNVGTLGNGNVVNGGGLVFNRSGSLTVDNVISGAGGITNNGAGTLTVSGNNSGFSGGVVVNTGTLAVAHVNALGGTGTGTIVGGDATLLLQSNSSEPLTLNGMGVAGGGALRGDGSYTLGGGITLTGATRINADSGILTMSGGVTGTGLGLTVGGAGNTTLGTVGLNTGSGGTLTKDGAGTLTLSAAGNYDGLTAITGGVLLCLHTNGLGSTAAGTTVGAGTALQLQSGGTLAEPLTLSGTGVSGDGALRSLSTNTLSGAITLGSAARVNSDSGVLTLSGGVTGTGLALMIGGAGKTTIATAGINTGTGGSLTKDGTGTLVVTAAGDYTGGTTISNGTLLVTADGLLGAAGGALTLAGGTLQATNSFTMSRPVMVGGGAVDVGTGAALIWSGVVGGSGGSLTKAGNGTLSLGGSNTNSDGIILNAGTIQLVSGTPLGTGPLTINGGTIFNGAAATITATNDMVWSGSFTYSTVISAGLNMGAGAVTLTTNITLSMGVNGYSSLLTIGGNIGESGGSRSLTIAAGGSNPSYIYLTGSNTYSGGTVMTGAGLRIGSAQALGTGHFTISGGNLSQNSGVALTGISGMTWDGDFGLTCGPGAINVGSSPVTLVGARSFTIDNGSATVGGDISGAGASLTVKGTAYVGNLILTGSNTFDGGLTLLPGSANTLTLFVNHASALGAGPFTINAGTGQAVQLDNNSAGALTNTWNNTQNWNRSFTFVGSKGLHMGYGPVTLGTNVVVSVTANSLTVGGIGDAGQGWSLTKAGAGTLVLAGAGTSSGTTIVNAGTLLAATNAVIATNSALVVAGGALFSNDLVQAVGSIAGAGTIGQGATGVLSNGFDNTSTIFSGVIAGAGVMVKDGAGTLTLAGSNTFTGGATIRSGALLVNGSLAAGGVMSVDGGVLGGTGTVDRTVLLTAGGTLNAGDPAVSAGVGTLTVAALTLEAGGTNVVEFASISSYDKVVVSAANGLTNNGGKIRLLVAGTTDSWDTNGVYNLFQYSGTAPDVSTLSVLNMTAGKDYLFQASGGYVSLTISETIVSGGAAVWDGGDTVNNLWSSATNWVGDTVPTNSSELRFDGTTRLTSVNDLQANTQFIGMTFLAGGGAFTLNGNTVNLAGNLVNSNANLQTVNLPLVLDGNSRELDAVVGDIAVGGSIDDGSETWGITKTGAGTVTLTGANTYDGSTTINAGILQVGDGGGSGTLGYGVVANDSALVLNRTGTLTVSNAIGGVGSITNNGSGTVILAGNSSYSGNTAINAGTVVAAHANALGGVAAGTTVSGGATLQVQTGGTLAEPVTLNGAGVADGGALRGVGTNTLSGVLTLSGATRVNNDSGVMTLSGGVAGTGQVLTIGGAGNITVSSAGLNTGSGGALVKDGTGTLTLAASGDFTGGTTISNGTVAVNADNVLGTGALDLAGGTLRSTNSYTTSRSVIIDAAGGTLNIEGASVLTVSGTVSGPAGSGLTKAGPGTLALGGANTYAGGTTLNAGVLRLANSTALGTGPLAINGGALNNTSAVTLTTTNDMTWNASFLVDYPSGAGLDIGRGSVTLTTNLTLAVGSGWGTLFVVNGAIGEAGGSRSLTITGAANPGFVHLKGTNTYSGGTILAGSGIRIGNTQALGTGPLTINGGTLSQNIGSALTGVPLITVASNFSFSCTAGAINLGVVPVTLSGVRTFSIDNGGVTIGGTIAGVGGGMVVNGTGYNGSLTLSGSNTFSGGISLAPGTANLTLYVNHAAALGTGPLTINRGSGGTPQLDNSTGAAITNLANNAQNWNASFTFLGNRNLHLGSGAVTLGTNAVTVTVSANTLTVGGAIGDGGQGWPLSKAGGGTLVLAGASTYAGETTVVTGKLTMAVGGSVAGNVHVMPGATLELSTGSAIADTATLELSTNGASYAVAILSNAVPEVVTTLILGTNVYTEAGTYGSPSSPAMFKYSGFFSGPGVIRTRGNPGGVYTIR